MFNTVAVLVLISVIFSCHDRKDSAGNYGRISQQEDGSFLLKLDEAACYSDKADPSGNTAEWSFVVPDAGRYKVWLSSAAKDTTDLGYSDSVKISLLDNHIEKIPECDKIVKDSQDVAFPYFRTDSYMGSFYFPEAGEYNIQVISEKVLANGQDNSQSDNTKLMSLILIPMTR